MYKLVFTDLAKAAAEAKFSIAAVEEQARREIAGVLGEGFEHLWRNIIFHSFEMPGTDQEFMVYPRDAETMEIDTSSSYESLGEIDTGLLPAGEFMLPRRDSE